MKEANIGNFVLIEAGGKKVVVGADAIKPVRIITSKAGFVPEELLLEDGSRVKVVYLESAEIVGKKDVEKVQERREEEVSVANEKLKEIKEILASTLPAWPQDLPPEENILNALEITNEIAQLKSMTEKLEQEYKQAFSKVSERWNLLLKQLSVVKRNYQKAVEERERISRNLTDLE